MRIIAWLHTSQSGPTRTRTHCRPLASSSTAAMWKSGISIAGSGDLSVGKNDVSSLSVGNWRGVRVGFPDDQGTLQPAGTEVVWRRRTNANRGKIDQQSESQA